MDSQKYWERATSFFGFLYALAIIATAIVFAILIYALYQVLSFNEAEYLFPNIEQDSRIRILIVTLICFGSSVFVLLFCGGVYFAAQGKLWELIETKVKDDEIES